MARPADRFIVEVHPEGGVHLAGTLVWFDSVRPREFCFVSNAASLSRARHGQLLVAPETLALRGRRETPATLTATAESFSLGELSIHVLPAGGMPGNAMCLVGWHGARLLYAPHVRTLLPEGWPRPQLPPADMVVLHAPSPPRGAAESVGAVAQHLAQRAAQNGSLPMVVFAESPGPAQELLMALAPLVEGLAVSPTVARHNRVYRAAGVALPPVPAARPPAPSSALVLAAASPRDMAQFTAPPPKTLLGVGPATAVVRAPRIEWTPGWSVPPGEPLAAALQCGAARALLLGEGAPALVKAFEAEGIEVTAIAPPVQESLFKGLP